MKVVILAGGYGSRISEESRFRPKPLLEIGGMPIIMHIIKTYYHYGFNEFIICAGYKQEQIKQYFYNYFINNSDVTFDISNNEINIHKHNKLDIKVSVIDTGLDTLTAGRIKRIKEYIDTTNFMLTYADGVGDININSVLDFHLKFNKVATICLYKYNQTKGVVSCSNNLVTSFNEKNSSDKDIINIGYMVLNVKVFDYIKDDTSILEVDVLNKLVSMNEVAGYMHNGFWQCMDTLKEKDMLNKMWEENKALWKVW